MIQDPRQRARLLEHFAFLRTAERDFREGFFGRAVTARLPAGHIICHDGGSCAQLALALAGTARIYKLGENGREVTLYRIGPGESCVVTAACILSERPFPAFAVCETEIEAVVVGAADVRRWMAVSAPWREFVFGLVADRLGEVFGVLDAILFKPLDQRLAALLLHRWHAAGRPATLHTTHQALAVELGSSREVITRLLGELEERGALRTGRGRIELLEPRLLEAHDTMD
ncbi:Crp/Fnr family transcription regulator [Marichromatium purpuratum 984]|uniref:Crp/Fnr family transcription regulator n=1 Tax=Marichromatium purpuratum 984 TaxID=765910 RepID=W0DXC3_MARPU|nr:Crp/Fnr family transcriptional regulator [Marichromatium purpuratum]AHF03235.1 Crp/Fnr family transcription regulator [Marichromatium purpuratum 984]